MSDLILEQIQTNSVRPSVLSLCPDKCYLMCCLKETVCWIELLSEDLTASLLLDLEQQCKVQNADPVTGSHFEDLSKDTF